MKIGVAALAALVSCSATTQPMRAKCSQQNNVALCGAKEILKSDVITAKISYRGFRSAVFGAVRDYSRPRVISLENPYLARLCGVGT